MSQRADYNAERIKQYFRFFSQFPTVDVFRVKCSADVTLFPFDQQTCGLLFLIRGYTNKDVELISSMTEMETTRFLENGKWDLKETHVNNPTFSVTPMLEFELTIERRAAFFIVNILVPPVTLGFLSVLVFLTPIESGERISYCITILLTVGVFLNLVTDHLPANSVNMPSICYYLFVLFIETTLICLCCIVSVRLYYNQFTILKHWIISPLKQICALDKHKRKQNETDVTNYENDVTHNGVKSNMSDVEDNRPKTSDELSMERKEDEESAMIGKENSVKFDCVCFVVFLLLNVISITVYMGIVL